LGAIKDGVKTGPSGLTANDLGIYDYSADSRFGKSPPNLSNIVNATPMQLHGGEPLGAMKDGVKTGPSGLTANDLGLFDYSADDRFSQTPQSIADVDYNATPMQFHEGEPLGATKDGVKTGPSGWTASTVKDSDVYSAAIDDSMEVLGFDGIDGTPMQLHKGKLLGAIKDGPKTGPSGTNATDAKLKNLVESMTTGGSGLFNSLDPVDMAIRAVTGFDTTQDAIDAHRSNKYDDRGDGLAGYMDESTDGYKAVSGNPYHIRSGRDVGNLSGNENLPLGGIPAALAGGLFQQFDDFGKEGLLQSIDNARGLALSGNAPAVQSIFDFVDSASDNIAAGKERDAVIKKEIKEKTFTPRVVAPKKKVEAKKKKTTPKRVTVNYNKNKPVKVKSKPSRTPVPKVTRTTGSRGGRGNVSKKKKTYTSRGRW
jgi:hypothetical protein